VHLLEHHQVRRLEDHRLVNGNPIRPSVPQSLLGSRLLRLPSFLPVHIWWRLFVAALFNFSGMCGPVDGASSNIPSNSSSVSSGGSSCMGAVYQTAHEKVRPQGNDETYGRATTTFIHSETVQPPYCFQFVPTGYKH